MPLFGRRPIVTASASVSSPVDSSANALTASGFRVTARNGDQLRRLIQEDQAKSFMYYDRLGEIKYAAQFYSRGLANLELVASEKNDDGEIEPTENEMAKQLLERIQDPGGGRAALLGAYGRLMFLTGEAMLFVSEDPDTGMEQWEMLSTDELRVQGGTYIRYQAPSLAAEEYHDADAEDWTPVEGRNAVAYRLWQRHPRYSMLADCTMLGVLNLCEELLLLEHAVRARARSRLAGAGILLLANELSATPLEPVPDEDPAEDPFMDILIRAMTTPLVDEGNASAVVPILLRGSLEAIKDGIKHLQIVDPTQLYPETGLRRECIERIAIGLDMPPEILLGLTDSNHWTAWMVDEQTWKGHLQPKAQQLVDDLSASYFRPALRAAGVQDWQRYSITYDATQIINHPDRTKDAKELYALRAIGKEALRTAAGFDETDAPTEDELAEMIGVQTNDSSLAWYGEPAPRGGNVLVGPGDIVGPDGNGSAPATGGEVETGPPAEPTVTDETVIGAGNGNGGLRGALLASRIMGASDLGVMRAREVAGNRVRNYARRSPEVQAFLENVPKWQAVSALNPAQLAEIGAPDASTLVEGARGFIVDALRLSGVTGSVAEQIAERVEKHAARTLHMKTPSPLPSTFNNYIAALTQEVPA